MQYSYEVPEGKSQKIPLRVYIGIFGKYLTSRWKLVAVIAFSILVNIVLRIDQSSADQ